MSETPTQDVSTLTITRRSLANELSWFKHHIILLAVVVVLVIGSVYGIESVIAKARSEESSKWQAISQAQTEQVKTLSDKLTVDESIRAQENAQQNAILVQLATAISQRDKAVAVQIQKDATLDAAGAAQKITQQTKAQPGEVVAQGNNVQMDLSVSRIVASNQDLLPAVQLDLTDTKKQLVSETTIANNYQSDVVQEADLVTSMKVQEASADKACKSEISNVKAQARKSKIKYLLFGGAIAEGIKLYFTHSL